MRILMGLIVALLTFCNTAYAGKSGGTQLIIVQDADDAEGRFWNLKAGSASTMDNVYTTPAGDVKGVGSVIKVVKVDGQECTLKSTTNGNSVEMIAGSNDGYYCWGPIDNGKFKPTMRLFKYGAKAGDTWDGWVQKADNAPMVTAKYVGLEEVTVPAGTYKDVVHVQAVITDGPTMDYYFAPKTGLIKLTILMHGAVSRVEMSAFTAGK